jgi:hypothetical protein
MSYNEFLELKKLIETKSIENNLLKNKLEKCRKDYDKIVENNETLKKSKDWVIRFIRKIYNNNLLSSDYLDGMLEMLENNRLPKKMKKRFGFLFKGKKE